MSTQGDLPSAPRRSRGGTLAAFGIALVVIAIPAFAAGWFYGAKHMTHVTPSPARDAVAYVLDTPCLDGPCESLWLRSGRDARRLEVLGEDSEWCEEIAWTPDGGRVGFLINGYQLRVFDARTGANVGAATLIEPDRTPPSRIARGVTFSTNGAAVTFDNCPREHSGCQPGLVALTLTR